MIASLLLCEQSIAQKSPTSEADLKKQAEKQYNIENYAGAAPLYSQLLSLYSKNAEYNYRYGVCLLLSSKDRSGAVSYLENASKDATIEFEVFYYLGRSYMINNNYSAAQAAFENFKKKANNSKVKKLNVDLLISNCKNGMELSKNRKNVVIIDQQQVVNNWFYTAYATENESGKMLATPDRFLTSEDKQKVVNPTMFLTSDGQTIYYASYGKRSDSGKDIYRANKLANGSWSEPENLGSVINSVEDENYPFLDHDGITLYFSSKGHNSVGGYDVFKTVYDRSSGQWSVPENLGIPINTPDDDVLFIPSYKGDFAQYASAIESDQGKIGVRKIKLGDVVNNLTTIQGQFISADQPQRRDAKISVIRIMDNGLVTSVRTDPRNGKYKFDLPPGEDYTLVIEAGGYLPHAENFSIPHGLNSMSLKQEVKLVKSSDVEKMTLSNYFTVNKNGSDETPATISNEPTSVVSNEYHLKDNDQSKMRAIDIKGRTVYVVPPKNIIETRSGSVTGTPAGQTKAESLAVDTKNDNSEIKSNSAATEEKLKSSANDGRKSSNSNSGVNKKLNDEAKQFTYDELKSPEIGNKVTRSTAELDETDFSNENNAAEQPDQESEEIAAINEMSNNPEPLPVMENEGTEDNSLSQNSSDKKQLKVIHDEKSADNDPEIIAKRAEVTKKIALEQDSVSKSQIVKAKEMLLAGGSNNMENAKTLFKESENNKKQSDARIKKAQILESHAEQHAVANNSSMAQSVRQSNSVSESTASKNQSSETQHELNEVNDIKANETGSLIETEAKAITTLNDKNKEVPNGKSSNELKKEDSKDWVKVKEEQKNLRLVPKQNSNKATNPVMAVNVESFSSSNPSSNNQPAEITNTPGYAMDNGNNNQPVAVSKQPLSENAIKAKESYHQHEQLMTESQQMAAIASKIETKINDMPASPKRDSLLALSNELNSKSVKKWQEAQQKLTEAKSNDPKVEEIVKEENKNKQKSGEQLAANQRGVSTASQIKKQNEGQELQASSAAATKGVTTEVKTKKEPEIAVATKKETAPASASTGDLNVKTDNQDINEANVDVSSPVYPEYVATKEKIKAKQKETINVFAEGVKYNKLSQQKKEEELTSRAKVSSSTDMNFKMQELKKASALKNQADSLDVLSQERFRTAQLTTGEVVILNHRASALKAEMNKPILSGQNQLAVANTGDKNLTPGSTDKTVTSDHQKNEAATPGVSESSPGKNDASQKIDDVASNAVTGRQLNDKLLVTDAGKNEVNNTNAKVILPNNNSSSNVKANSPNKNSASANEIKKDGLATISNGSTVKKPELIAYATVDDQIDTKKKDGNKILADATKPLERTSVDNKAEIQKQANENVFNYANKPVYSAANPIPMNPSLPSGLIFKVQVGAFHSPLPNGIFKNLQPVTGETTRPGWIRYCVGLFKAYESANLVKNEMRKAGYQDAFVVAYYNGSRITMAAAFAQLSKSGSEEKKLYARVAATETSHLKTIKFAEAADAVKDGYRTSLIPGTSAMMTAGTGAIEYAVQVGVYKTPGLPPALTSLMPLLTETTKKGMYRFVTPRYSSLSSANIARNNAVSKGIKDAFIIAYKNGSKVSLNSLSSANQKTDDRFNIRKQENEKMNVNYNAVTTGVIYKVQLGAFRNKISDRAVIEFKKVAPDVVSQESGLNGLHVYYSGEFKNLNDALAFKNVVVSKGIKDAFVVVFQNGKKIPLAQEQAIQTKSN